MPTPNHSAPPPGANRDWSSALDPRLVPSDFVVRVGQTFGTRILVLALRSVTSIVTARILAPEGRGQYALALSISALAVQSGTLGLHASNTYTVARSPGLLPALLGNSLVVSFALGGLAAAGTGLLFSAWPAGAPVHGALLALALVLVPFGLANLLTQNLLLGLQDLRAYNWIELTGPIIGLALLGAAILLRAVTVELAVTCELVAVILTLGRSLGRVARHAPRPATLSLSLLRDGFAYGVRQYAASFVAFLMQRADLFLINYYLGTEQAGIYSIAVSLAGMISILPTVVGTVTFPRLCAMRDWNARIAFVRRTSAATALVMLPLTGLAVWLSPPAIQLLFGASYAAAFRPFVWLMPGVLIWSVESLFRQVLVSDGYRNEVLYAWILALTANLVLNVSLIPRLGLQGSALASSLSLLVLSCVTLPTVWREHRRHHA